MIVFDLQCPAQHRFEAWFGSSADYESQRARGLIACPVCDSADVEKAVMAPAVAPKSSQRPAVPLERMLAFQRALEAGSQWVGDRFAEEARALHARGEARAIHGQASLAEARALLEEGVPVLPLPFRPRAASDA